MGGSVLGMGKVRGDVGRGVGEVWGSVGRGLGKCVRVWER